MGQEIVTKKRFVTQLKIADMFSMGGIGLIGIGLGANFHDDLLGIIPAFILVGLILHALGMYGKFQIEREHLNPPGWVLVVFGACWLCLMLAGLYILIGRLIVTIL